MDAAIATTATSNLVAQQRACGGDRCDGERSAGATTAVDAAIATTRFAVGDTVPGLGLEITRVVQPWGCHGLKAVYACRRVIQEHAQGQAPPPFSRHSSQWALIQFARSKETATLATIEGVLDREAAWNWAHVPARFPATRHLVTPTTDKYRLVSVVQWCGEHLLEAAARATPRDPRGNDAVPSPSSQGHSLCMQDVWRNLPGLLRTLRVLHLHSLLHKDIAPHNLCFLPGQSPSMGRITLIDFGAVTNLQNLARVPWAFSWRHRAVPRLDYGSLQQHLRHVVKTQPHPLDDIEALLYSLLHVAVILACRTVAPGGGVRPAPVTASMSTEPPSPQADRPMWECVRVQPCGADMCRRSRPPGAQQCVTPYEAHVAASKLRLDDLLADPTGESAGGKHNTPFACLHHEDRNAFRALFRELRSMAQTAGDFREFVQQPPGDGSGDAVRPDAETVCITRLCACIPCQV